jgi:hypothetical protein
MALRLGFDMDGVLADFRSAFQGVAREVLHHSVEETADPEQDNALLLSTGDLNRVWRAIARSQNWWTRLQAYEPFQIERLYKASRKQRWEVFFLTKRPQTAGEPVQFQTQWWLEAQGFLLPSVVTVLGSRGELANALRLDLVVDDQFINCADVIGASQAKAILLMREPDQAMQDQATTRGIGVVRALEHAIDVAERLQELLPEKRSRLSRLADWFVGPRRKDEPIKIDPADFRPLPPLE